MPARKEITWIVDENGCHNCNSHYRDKDGYPKMRPENCNQRAIHRVVYSKHYLNGEEIPKGMVVRHKCDNTASINPEHLELGLPKDNTRDMIERGRQPCFRGEKNSQAVLTEEMVKKIFLESGSCREIAIRFGLKRQTVSAIKHKYNWRYITDNL